MRTKEAVNTNKREVDSEGERMENVHDSNDELYPWANVGF